MAELATIARPYAEAVFRLAKEGNALAAWSEKLAFIAALYQDPQMQAAIGNPKVTATDVERLLLADRRLHLGILVERGDEIGRAHVLTPVTRSYRMPTFT